jgi:hypothetical protein
MNQFTQQQQASISSLEAIGFDLNKAYEIGGEISVSMNKHVRNGGIVAMVDPDGTVNGESLKDYKERHDELMKSYR